MRFEDMEIWERSSDLSVDIYRQLINLDDLKFKDQITCSGLLLSRTIAEGFSRETDKETRNFLDNARCTCSELRAQVYIGTEIGFISQSAGQKWINDTIDISRMLSSLIQFIDRKAINYLIKIKCG